MAITITTLSASQMDDLLRDEYRDRVETQVPFLDSDDTDWRMRDQTQRGQYMVAQDDGKIVGIRKFYLWENTKRDINQFLEGQGLPVVKGKVYQGAYVAVHPDYRRRGVGTALNNAVKDMLRPGDVLILGSHEPDGKALNRAWLASVKGQVNILYGRRLSIYADYDPTRVNYVVSDADNYGRDDFGRVAVGSLSPRPRMSPDDKVLRSRLIRLASANPDLRATILPLLKEGSVEAMQRASFVTALVGVLNEVQRGQTALVALLLRASGLSRKLGNMADVRILSKCSEDAGVQKKMTDAILLALSEAEGF